MFFDRLQVLVAVFQLSHGQAFHTKPRPGRPLIKSPYQEQKKIMPVQLSPSRTLCRSSIWPHEVSLPGPQK